MKSKHELVSYLHDVINGASARNVPNAMERLTEIMAEMMERLIHVDNEFMEKHIWDDLNELGFGDYMNQWNAKYAVSMLVNQDGSRGGHWTKEQTDAVFNSQPKNPTLYNDWDFYWVLNMTYSDHYRSLSRRMNENEVINTLIDMTMETLTDVDFKHKGYHLYKCRKD